jgi:hypothetical protein
MLEILGAPYGTRTRVSAVRETILSFAHAQEAARAWFADVARRDRGEAMVGSYTVRQCLDEYVAWLETHRKTGADARYRVDAHVMPTLGPIQCATLTTTQIQNWLRDLANSPARLRTKASAKKNECPKPGQERS